VSRKGFALVGALIAVILIGALIVGAFVATTEEARISGNVRTGAQVLAAAEAAAEGDIAGWAASEADSLAIAQRAVHSTAIGGLAVTTTLVRFDSTLYWIVGEASNPGSGVSVRRRIGLLLRRQRDSTGKTTLLPLEERPWSELF
jgi:hypothetical protein